MNKEENKLKGKEWLKFDSYMNTEQKKNKDYDSKVRELILQNEYINFDLLLDSLAISSKFMQSSADFDEIDRVR